MGLNPLTNRIYFLEHDSEVDRPMLAYLKGDKFSLAVDAGYSASHVRDFYRAIEEEQFNEPDFTVITHWHYDHTFGMHAINGISIAHDKTNGFLKDQQEQAVDPGYIEILKKEGVDDKVLHDAICAHNPKCGVKAKTNLQYAVLAADPMSGFVKAVAQIYPDKKVASVKHKSVMKRFNELRFAAGANRDYMEAIEFTGLSLDNLIDVALEEMCAIADELGL